MVEVLFTCVCGYAFPAPFRPARRFFSVLRPSVGDLYTSGYNGLRLTEARLDFIPRDALAEPLPSPLYNSTCGELVFCNAKQLARRVLALVERIPVVLPTLRVHALEYDALLLDTVRCRGFLDGWDVIECDFELKSVVLAHADDPPHICDVAPPADDGPDYMELFRRQTGSSPPSLLGYAPPVINDLFGRSLAPSVLVELEDLCDEVTEYELNADVAAAVNAILDKEDEHGNGDDAVGDTVMRPVATKAANTHDAAKIKNRLRRLLPVDYTRQDLRAVLIIDEPDDNWRFRHTKPCSSKQDNLLGRLHMISGKALKATCAVHEACKCMIDVREGSYYQVRNCLIEWIRDSQTTSREQHVAQADANFNLFSDVGG